ncbi:MAG: hypothetical protein ACLR0U_20295 [Enterocloster clostridioformis]
MSQVTDLYDGRGNRGIQAYKSPCYHPAVRFLLLRRSWSIGHQHGQGYL